MTNGQNMEEAIGNAVRFATHAAATQSRQFESFEPDSLLAAAEKAYQRARAIVEEHRPDIAHRAALFAVIVMMIDERKGLDDLVRRAETGGHAPR